MIIRLHFQYNNNNVYKIILKIFHTYDTEFFSLIFQSNHFNFEVHVCIILLYF